MMELKSVRVLNQIIEVLYFLCVYFFSKNYMIIFSTSMTPILLIELVLLGVAFIALLVTSFEGMWDLSKIAGEHHTQQFGGELESR